jgi:hypothetical protein
MATERTVSNKKLTPGKTYLIRGKVGFSKITRLTTDEERMEANKHRRYAIDSNYTTITLYDAQVLAKDPANPTPEEIYGKESLYISKSPNYTGQSFTAISKSQQLPRVAITTSVNADGTTNLQEIKPEGELAVGLDVTVQMRVFSSAQNNGVTIAMIIINESAPRYYGGNDLSKKALAEMGMILTELPPEQRAKNDKPQPVSMENDYPEDAGAMIQIDVPEQPLPQIPPQVQQTVPQVNNGFAPVANSGFAPINTVPVQQTPMQNQGFAPINQPVAQPQPQSQQATPVQQAPTNPFSSYETTATTPQAFEPGPNRIY